MTAPNSISPQPLTDAVISHWAKIQQLYPEANFLQSPAWGRMNELIGHKVLLESTPTSWCQMIVKNAKRGRYLEIPGGPLLDWQDQAAVQQVFARIRAIAKRERCVFVRFRPQLHQTPEHQALLERLGAKKSPMHLHAEHTVILDLTQSEDDLLKNMRRQTRYEVRRAAKLGLTVDWSDTETAFREFHEVQAETARRQHFVPPDLATLLAERAAFNQPTAEHTTANQPSAPSPSSSVTAPSVPTSLTAARLYIAKSPDGDPIAYGLILIAGVEAEYFEAASTALNQKLPGAYALQWQVIKDLKALKIQRYNLWGIAPPAQNGPQNRSAQSHPNRPQSQPAQKQHRYAGVTTFKTGFGGEIVEFVPAHDLVISHPRYLLNLLVETIRKKKRHL